MKNTKRKEEKRRKRTKESAASFLFLSKTPFSLSEFLLYYGGTLSPDGAPSRGSSEWQVPVHLRTIENTVSAVCAWVTERTHKDDGSGGGSYRSCRISIRSHQRVDAYKGAQIDAEKRRREAPCEGNRFSWSGSKENSICSSYFFPPSTHTYTHAN